MQNDTLVVVDIAKEVFEVGVSDRPGRVVRRSRLERHRFLEFFAQHPQATVVMEACGSAPIKSVTQQVLGTLHRLRSGWMADRTRATTSLRGLLRELGFFIPEGRKNVLPDAWEINAAVALANKLARDTGRTGTGKADNKPGLRGRFHRLAPLCADSIMAQGRSERPLQRGRRYVCSPSFAHHGPFKQPTIREGSPMN